LLMLSRHPSRNRVQRLTSLFKRHAIFETSHHDKSQVVTATEIAPSCHLLGVHHRHPEVRPEKHVCTAKTLGSHTDHLKRMLIQSHRHTDDVRTASELSLPELVAQYYVRHRSQTALLGCTEKLA